MLIALGSIVLYLLLGKGIAMLDMKNAAIAAHAHNNNEPSKQESVLIRHYITIFLWPVVMPFFIVAATTRSRSLSNRIDKVLLDTHPESAKMKELARLRAEKERDKEIARLQKDNEDFKKELEAYTK